MYALLKTYKNLENQYILGKTSSLERLETRVILIKFQSADLLLNEQINFLPFQQYFSLKDFLFENVVRNTNKVKELGYKKKFAYLLDKNFVALYKNSELTFNKNLCETNLNQISYKLQLNKFIKMFNLLERRYAFEKLKRIKIFFRNQTIYKYIYFFNYGKTQKKIFLKKYLYDLIQGYLTKSFKNKSEKNLFFQVTRVAPNGWTCKSILSESEILIPKLVLKKMFKGVSHKEIQKIGKTVDQKFQLLLPLKIYKKSPNRSDKSKFLFLCKFLNQINIK